VGRGRPAVLSKHAKQRKGGSDCGQTDVWGAVGEGGYLTLRGRRLTIRRQVRNERGGRKALGESMINYRGE